MTQRPPAPTAVPLLVAAGAGILMPVQALVTAAAAASMGSVLAAALLSQGAALGIVLLASVALPSGRRGWARVPAVWKERSVPRWFLLSGLVGAFYIVAQALSVGTIGLALFAVAVVATRTLGSIAIDVVGFSPAGRRRMTRQRLAGAGLLIVGAAVAAAGTGLRARDDPSAWWGLAVAAAAGLFVSFQQSMNSRAGIAYGATSTAIAVNYVAGVLGLLAACGAGVALGAPGVVPEQGPAWWHVLGGPLGIMFVVVGVTLVPRLGSLLLGIGLVTGQLLGSLLLDLVLAPERVAAPEVVGTLITLLAVLVASWQPGGTPRPRRGPGGH
ncbi:DMT family transporter [Arthrobacter halodurans]|uniref:DMT family transporter n=1 Tax=Arthrobacter halodurans TaxID=516699 RepID=A0ABV4UQZ4_9MICC